MYGTLAHLYKLVKMLVLIIVLSHWVGTLYHFLAQIEGFYGENHT